MIRVMTAVGLLAIAAFIVIVAWGIGALVATLLPLWAIFKWAMFAIGFGLVLLMGAALFIDGWVI